MSTPAPTNPRLLTAGVYPTGASGSYGTAARARVTWDMDYSGLSGTTTFRVNVDDGALTFTLAGTTATLELDLTGLPVNAARTFQVRAENAGGGNSAYVNFPFTTSDPVPASDADVPPTVNLAAALVTDTSVLLTWEYAGHVTTVVTFSAVSSDGGAGASATVSGLEKSVTITGLTAGKTYTFAVATFGQYALTVSTLQSYGAADSASAFCVMVTPDDTAPISGPSSLQLEVGVPAAGNWSYIGTGSVDSWGMGGVPTGVSGTLLTPTSDHRLAQLDGTPTADGIYGLSVNCRSQIGLVRSTSRYPVRVMVTGVGLGGCLAWFHDDSDHVDLQLDTRLRDLYSFAMPASAGNRSAQLHCQRGETQRLHIIPRDSGGNLITTAFVTLGYTIRLKDRRDGLILASEYITSPEITVETIGTHTNIPYLDLDLTAPNPTLEAIFTNLNRNPLAEPAANRLECELELLYQFTSGPLRSSNPTPVIITQDIDR